MTKNNPIIELTIPVKCSTVKSAYGKIDHAADVMFDIISVVVKPLINFAFSDLIAKLTIYALIIMAVFAYAAIFFLAGVIIFGLPLEFIQGGTSISQEAFVCCGVAGNIFGWAMLIYSTGFVKISCIKE